jgi:hypothetical protein
LKTTASGDIINAVGLIISSTASFMTETNEQTKTLRSLPITISGGWLENSRYKWKGSAVSSEQIVAVVFLRHGNITEWCKSSASSQSLKVILWISRYNEINLEAQVQLSVGSGDRRIASFLESANYKPNIEAEIIIDSGEILKFITVEGKPKISFEIIFIARSDVKFGRNRIWHLRENTNVLLPDEVKRILEKGRIGKFTTEKVL